MRYAISLYLGGTKVYAKKATKEMIYSRRLVCPKCLEPVKLVERRYSPYFSHLPEIEMSPECPMRVGSSGNQSSIGVSPRSERIDIIFGKEVFKNALLETYHLKDLSPLPPELKPLTYKLLKLMQEVYIKEDRCIDISDLPKSTLQYIKKEWGAPGEIIEKFLSDGTVIHDHLEPNQLKTHSLKRGEHLTTVLLLWRHLHLKRVQEDFIHLLKITMELVSSQFPEMMEPKVNKKNVFDDLFFSSFAGCILYWALGTISLVPWKDI